MALPRTIPALADLTQEIVGPVPLELLRRWVAGTQDVVTAEALLDGFRIRGTVVVTDTSGLSRLCDERDLLEVLALISRPKSIVHALGVAAGGRAVGTWVADNTRMYYPAPIPPEVVVVAMAEAQQRIAAAGCPGIGICVHSGDFYEIGGGLYGADAEAVEMLGEHHARSGEIMVTTPVAGALAATPGFELQPRPELTGPDGLTVFTLRTERRLPQAPAANTAYPHPYPSEVFDLISAPAGVNIDAAKQQIYARFLQRQTVMLVSVAHEAFDRGLTGLLDSLVINALMETVIRHAVRTADRIVNIGGGLAILTFDSPRAALDSALDLRARLLMNAIAARIGIDQGPVLLYANPDGRRGITGNPVNVASKISEDAGASGQISLTTEVAAALADLPPCLPFETTVSGITLSGVCL